MGLNGVEPTPDIFPVNNGKTEVKLLPTGGRKYSLSQGRPRLISTEQDGKVAVAPGQDRRKTISPVANGQIKKTDRRVTLSDPTRPSQNPNNERRGTGSNMQSSDRRSTMPAKLGRRRRTSSNSRSQDTNEPTGKPRNPTKSENSIFKKSSVVYDDGSKFKRLSSGRVDPAFKRCEEDASDKIEQPQQEPQQQPQQAPQQQPQPQQQQAKDNSNNNNGSTSTNTSTKQYLNIDKLAPHKDRSNLRSFIRNASSYIETAVASKEQIICKQSFRTDSESGGDCHTVITRGKCLVHNEGRQPSSHWSLNSTDDRILEHLIGNYDGPDRMGFTAEIVREVSAMPDLSTDSVVDFLLSKEYQGWIKQKAGEWESMMAFKSKINSTTREGTSGTSAKHQQYTIHTDNPNADPKPQAVPLVQIFRESGSDHVIGVQNHYNYDIKINANDGNGRRCKKCSNNCCAIL